MVLCGCVFFAKTEQGFDCSQAQFVAGLMDGGKRWLDNAAKFHVVEAEERDIIWHFKVRVQDGPQHAKGNRVVTGEDGGDSAGLPCKDCLRHFAAPGEAVFPMKNGDGIGRHRLDKSLFTVGEVAVARRAGEVSHLAVSKFEQIFGGQGTTCFVVGADGGEWPACTVEQHDGDADGFKALLLIFVEDRDRVHEDAIHPFPCQGCDVFHVPRGVLIAVTQHQVATSGPRRVFGTTGDFRKKGVTDVTDNEAQGVGSTGDKAAGYPIDPVVQALRNRQDTVACVGLNAVGSAEGAGDGGDVNPRFTGYIFDGYLCSQAFAG